MWKTCELVRCEQYSHAHTGIVSGSREWGNFETFVKMLYLRNDKEQDGSSTNVWLTFLLLMIMNHKIFDIEISSGVKL
jgi:hypothetical protein